MATQNTVPVLSRITDELLATLKTVRTVSGYTIDLKVEDPDAPEGNGSCDGLAILLVAQARPEDEADQLIGFSGYAQDFDISLTRIQPESNETPIRNLLWAVASDVQRAIGADIHRGGLAYDTLIGQPEIEYLDASANAGVITVPVTVFYRTHYNNAFRSAYEA